MNSNIVAENLKLERRRLGFTQQQMADAGGVSKSSQVGYEAGARVPDASYLRSIAAAGADVLFVLFGERHSEQGRAPFDWQLHDRILGTIEEWLNERDLQLPFDKKMELLRLFVAHFDVVRRIDMDFVHEQLSRAA